MACNGQTLVQRSGGLELLFFPFKDLKGGRPETKEKELNRHRFEDFAAVKTVGACCIVSKLTRMPNVRATFRMRPKILRLTSHCRAESRAAQVRLATLFAFHGAVQIIARSSPTHDLERRLVGFLRLHRATLCCADFRV